GVRVLAGAVIADGAANDYYPLQYPFSDDCLAHHTFAEPVRVPADPGLTFADVVHLVGFESAVVELGDDHVLSWHCPGCGTDTHEGRAVPLVAVGDADCPQCRQPRQFEPLTSVAVPSPRAGHTLADVGVRPDEVLAVRSGMQYRYLWVQHDAHLPEGW
ncbi:MAG: hypothetical protein Q7V88_16805, partial [Actinomycetota bacterium]|nr:hypothetical protein [Actinomycetota bacterium]